MERNGSSSYSFGEVPAESWMTQHCGRVSRPWPGRPVTINLHSTHWYLVLPSARNTHIPCSQISRRTESTTWPALILIYTARKEFRVLRATL